VASTFTIAGKHVPKWAAFGAAGVAVVGGVLYLRSRNSSGSGSSGTSDSSATDPVTGLPYSEDNQIDPATGLTYLSEAEQYGSVAAAEAAVGAGYGGVSGTTGEGASGEAYGEPTYTTPEGTGETYLTNAQWAAAIQAALPAITGDTSADVATAIANYLASLPQASAAGVTDMQVALAEFGPAPGGGGAIIAPASSSGATGTGSSTSGGSGASTGNTSGTSATAAVPDCSGQTTGQAHNTLTAAGFKAVAQSGQTDNLTCTGTNPPAGTVLAKGASVTILASGVTVPQCKGMTAGAAHNAIQAAGLHAVAPSGQKATAECTGTSPAGGQVVSPGTNVTINT
jgi:hypothetical protein